MNTSTRSIDRVVVTCNASAIHCGFVEYAGNRVPCALGRNGIAGKLREGDGITPLGTWPMRYLLFRPDRVRSVSTGLPKYPIRRTDGWCDAPGDTRYNQRVDLPYPASYEDLWRDDNLYDLLVVLGFNDDPVVSAAGSAIFFHLAQLDYCATEGCVAVARSHMLDILRYCDSKTIVEIKSP